jgi:hypothetical protein
MLTIWICVPSERIDCGVAYGVVCRAVGSVVGRLIERGLHDANDRQNVIVDGVDGRHTTCRRVRGLRSSYSTASSGATMKRN